MKVSELMTVTLNRREIHCMIKYYKRVWNDKHGDCAKV